MFRHIHLSGTDNIIRDYSVPSPISAKCPTGDYLPALRAKREILPQDILAHFLRILADYVNGIPDLGCMPCMLSHLPDSGLHHYNIT